MNERRIFIPCPFNAGKKCDPDCPNYNFNYKLVVNVAEYNELSLEAFLKKLEEMPGKEILTEAYRQELPRTFMKCKQNPVL